MNTMTNEGMYLLLEAITLQARADLENKSVSPSDKTSAEAWMDLMVKTFGR